MTSGRDIRSRCLPVRWPRRPGLAGPPRRSRNADARGQWSIRIDDQRRMCFILPDGKTGGRLVPLGPEARDGLADLPRDDNNPWVIAGRLQRSHLTDLQHPWRCIRKRAGLENVRIHERSCAALRRIRSRRRGVS